MPASCQGVFALCLAGSLTMALRSGAAGQEDSLPNFIVIMADDVGASELGCYNSAGVPCRRQSKAEFGRLVDGLVVLCSCTVLAVSY